MRLSRLLRYRNADLRLVLALALSAYVTYTSYRFFLKLPFPAQTYTDLIAGPIGWTDYNKLRDYALLGSLAVVFSLGFNLFALFLVPAFARRKRAATDRELVAVGIFSLWVGLFVFETHFTADTYLVLTASVVAMGYAILPRGMAAKALSVWAPIIEEGITSLFVLVAAGVILRFALPKFSSVLPWETIIWMGTGAVMAVRRIPRVVLARAQALIPFVLLAPLCSTAQQGFQLVHFPVPGPALAITLVAIGSFVYLDIKTLWARPFDDKAPLLSNISVACISALLATHAVVPGVFAGDEFHLGEVLLPWQQYRDFGIVPFREMISVQGLMGLMYGCVHDLLFGGNLGSFQNAASWIHSIIGFGTGLLLARRMGSFWAVLLLPLFTMAWDRLSVLNLWILFFLDRSLWSRPAAWLALWLPLGLLHFLYNASAGMAAMVGTFPAVVYQLYRVQKQFGLRWWFVTSAVWGASFFGLFPILKPWAEFVWTNGRMNAVAYAVGMMPKAPKYEWSPLQYLLARADLLPTWNAVQVAPWFLVLALSLFFGVSAFRERSIRALLCWIVFICAVILAPYSFGRMEQYGMDRSQYLTAWAFGGLFSLVLIDRMLQRKQQRFAVLILMLMFVVHLRGAPQWTLGAVIARATSMPILAASEKILGPSEPNQRFRNSVLPSEEASRFADFHAAVETYTRSNETYFDFTNRSLQYYLLHKRALGPLPSIFHTANTGYQEQTVERLKAEKVPLVVAAPFLNPDAEASALRYYRVYRWLVESGRYVPVRFRKMELLVAADRFNQRTLSSESRPDNAVLTQMAGRADLAALPTAWGRNWKFLQYLFSEGIDVLSESSKMRSFSVAKTEHADFLLMHFSTTEGEQAATQVRLRLNTDCSIRAGKTDEVTFTVRSSPALIPLGIAPCWLQRRGTAQISAEVLPLSGAAKWKLDRVLALRLKN